jgi:hypothetical protein
MLIKMYTNPRTNHYEFTSSYWRKQFMQRSDIIYLQNNDKDKTIAITGTSWIIYYFFIRNWCTG